MTDGVGNLAPDLGHARKCDRVKWGMGSPLLITGSTTTIQKEKEGHTLSQK